jgi:hypothetical protein
VQAETVEQAIPERLLDVVPVGRAVLWELQLVPFHASARATPAPARLLEAPTASQAVAAVHETPPKVPCRTIRLGLGSLVQPALADTGLT